MIEILIKNVVYQLNIVLFYFLLLKSLKSYFMNKIELIYDINKYNLNICIKLIVRKLEKYFSKINYLIIWFAVFIYIFSINEKI